MHRMHRGGKRFFKEQLILRERDVLRRWYQWIGKGFHEY